LETLMSILDKIQRLNITPTVKAAIIQGCVALLIFGLGARYGRLQAIQSAPSVSKQATKPFNEAIKVDELLQFDKFMDQYRSGESSTNIQESYRVMEYIDMDVDSLRERTFAGKRTRSLGTIRDQIVKSYLDLKEAHQARIESIEKVFSKNTIGAASDVAKARAKSESASLNYLFALLAYENIAGMEQIPVRELQPVISKYRGITGCNMVVSNVEE